MTQPAPNNQASKRNIRPQSSLLVASPLAQKQCTKCNRVLDISEFYVRKTTGKHDAECKHCNNEDARRRYAAAPRSAHPTGIRGLNSKNLERRVENQQLEVEGKRRCTGCNGILALSEFYVQGGRVMPCCRECEIERSRAKYAGNKPAHKRMVYDWRRRNPASVRAIRRRQTIKRHGITAKDYDVLLERQGGTCAICKKLPTGDHFAVDHDHLTDRVRGLLCDPCNQALGLLSDDVGRIESMIAYITRHQFAGIDQSGFAGAVS